MCIFRMVNQLIVAKEAFIATFIVALVLLLTCMSSQMVHLVASWSESFITMLTFVWLLSGVCSLMYHKVWKATKLSAAYLLARILWFTAIASLLLLPCQYKQSFGQFRTFSANMRWFDDLPFLLLRMNVHIYLLFLYNV